MCQVPRHPERAGLLQGLTKVAVKMKEVLGFVNKHADRGSLTLRDVGSGESELPKLTNH